MLEKITRNKKYIFLGLVILFSTYYFLASPLIGAIGILIIYGLFLPIKNIGIIIRIIFSFLIYSSLLLLSGLLLYFLKIKFNIYIDLLILLALTIPSILYSKNIDFKITSLFPIRELVLLSIMIFTIVSMGTYLHSHSSLQARIEQLARGSDSDSHYLMTNEVYTFKHYYFSKNDAPKLSYNIESTNPYPQGIHYVMAQLFLFTDNKNTNNYENIKRHLSVFLWFNLILFSILLPLILFYTYKLFVISNWWSIAVVFSLLVFGYFHYYQTLLMYGFYPNILGLCIIVPLIYILINSIGNKLLPSNLIYLVILIASLSFVYTMYLPPILISVYILYRNKELDLSKFNKKYVLGFYLFILITLLIIAYIVIGEGFSSVTIPGGIVQIPFSVIIPILLIAYYGYKKNNVSKRNRLYNLFFKYSVIWMIFIGAYQLIEPPHRLAYYYYKNVYLVLILSMPLLMLGLKEIAKYIKNKKPQYLYASKLVLAIISLSAIYSGVQFSGNHYFDTNTYFFPNTSTSNNKNYESSMITGLNISNKSAYDISNWIKNGESTNLVFLDDCGINDSYKSNKVMFALTLNGNWANYELSNNYSAASRKSFDQKDEVVKFINTGIQEGRPIELYTLHPELFKENKLNSNQKIIPSNEYTCFNY